MKKVQERRRLNPLRWLLAAACGLAGGAALVVASAKPGNVAGLPVVEAGDRTMMTWYGIAALVVSFLVMVTPRRRPAPVEEEAPLRSEDDVVRALREHGWYVIDHLQLPKIDVDHVAVGPAGVLAIQSMFTNRADPRGKADARARIAAEQLRGALKQREVDVEVVPAVLAWGPGLPSAPSGVVVHDSVAVLIGERAEVWLDDLSSHQLLDDAAEERVRDLIGDLAEQRASVAPLLELAGA